MENRNHYNSPRDRIDDALLIRLLNEEEPATGYTPGGCMPSCRERARSRSDMTNCRNTGRNERTDNGCGCEAPNRRERQENRCGCEEQNERTCGRCGEPRNRCGCQENGYRESCSCGGPLSGYPLAMVYVPDHDWDDMFDEEEALVRGTLFKGLDLPFYPGKCGCR